MKILVRPTTQHDTQGKANLAKMPQKRRSKELFKALVRKHHKICRWHHGIRGTKLKRSSGDEAMPQGSRDLGSALLPTELQHPQGSSAGWDPTPGSPSRAPRAAEPWGRS